MPSFSLLRRGSRDTFRKEQQAKQAQQQQQQPQQEQQQLQQILETQQPHQQSPAQQRAQQEAQKQAQQTQQHQLPTRSRSLHQGPSNGGAALSPVGAPGSHGIPEVAGEDKGTGSDSTGTGSDSNGTTPTASTASTATGTPTRRERRNSKRDLLHDLISRGRLIGKQAAASTPLRGRRMSSQPPPTQRSTSDVVSPTPTSTSTTLTPIPTTSTTSTAVRHASLSPRSPIPIDQNKPLPSPPPPGSEQTKDPPVKATPVLKLERIMASLSDDEIEKLFSGAPQYFARSEGHGTGAPHPSVAFPWDEQLEIRDLTDHVQIEDRAWSCVTAWPHITRDVQPDRTRAQRLTAKKRHAHYYPRCRERPNMLSMAGLEKGSLGYQAALELGVSDALDEEQPGFETLGARSPAVIEQRQKMLTSRDGLRHMDEGTILEQLMKNGRRYTEHHLRERRVTSELYNELFLHILHPPTKVLDHQDPYSLSVQILALIKVLAVPTMWIDFSHVEWRIKLGQLIWGTEEELEAGDGDGDGAGDDASVRSANANSNPHSAGELLQEERYWLLLQILLASELLVRLDAITEGDELGIENVTRAEVARFEKEGNRSVRWSLHLARAWLENIEVVKAEKKALEEQDRSATGWLATLTKRMSLTAHGDPGLPKSHHHHSHLSHHHASSAYAIKGRHCERQVNGLTHFAHQLRWPDISAYEERISVNCRALIDGTPLSTPLASPMSRDSRRSSYFGGSSPKPETGSNANAKPKVLSRRSTVRAALNASGWLSKSYISGLMLPGEGLCHFVMSALLENDPAAMERLGPMANLCGGFVYCGKSFWSTACVVGRVLAAGKGSAECMGWISSDITPQNLGDGWVDIEVENVPEDAEHIHNKARLWHKAAVERQSYVLGDADPSMVLPADFIIPTENTFKEKPAPSLWIELKSLALWAPVDSVRTTPVEEKAAAADDAVPTPFSDVTRPPEIHTYPAALSFAVSRDDEAEVKEVSLVLTHDVYFVTAHPCVPSQHVKIMKSPTSPTIQQVDLFSSGGGGKMASVIGHPLHKYYTYVPIHLSDLLRNRSATLDDLLATYSSASHRPSLTPTSTSAAKFLVIDCITGFQSLPQEHEIPLSPTVSRSSTATINDFDMSASAAATPTSEAPFPGFERAGKKMHSETRRRQFGSDMEVLVRALCADRGWNALISRRRRGCLACAIREAGALGWKVVIRVE